MRSAQKSLLIQVCGKRHPFLIDEGVGRRFAGTSTLLSSWWLIYSPLMGCSVRLPSRWLICPPLRATGKGPSNVMAP
ncbi:hypothetical protein BTJ39_12185 [Izhakiella australiensis]|uniref:Uncharacterized protein n=1 Tax=Izhakiella australiensis TaxID=1926881 RepID=A0A1S8YLP3_9GAMM|nr:hypothetical protein BTJ39_12185 [Izhakiella australiensis]